MLIINHMYNIKEIQIYNRTIHKVNLIGEQNPYFGWNMKRDANQMKEKCTSYCKTSCEIAFTTIVRGKNSFILKFNFSTCDHYPYLLNVQQILCIYCYSMSSLVGWSSIKGLWK